MIGILGGMGPYATIAFYQKVLDITDAKKDSDHIHLLIDSNTKIPSRNRHFIFNEESPVKGMLKSINNMKELGIKKVYLPCNSASYFIPEILEYTEDVEVIGTIDVTIDYVSQNYANKRCMVLGAFIVYNKEPYKEKLQNKGFKYINHNAELQQEVEAIIYSIKGNTINETLVERTLSLYKQIIAEYDIDILILGCTELCIVFDKLKNLNLEIVDTNFVLAQNLVKQEG